MFSSTKIQRDLAPEGAKSSYINLQKKKLENNGHAVYDRHPANGHEGIKSTPKRGGGGVGNWGGIDEEIELGKEEVAEGVAHEPMAESKIVVD